MVKSIYMEAEWDPADPLGETVYQGLRRAHRLPTCCHRPSYLWRTTLKRCCRQAACPLMRSIRQSQPPRLHRTPSSRASRLAPIQNCAVTHLGTHGLHFDLQTPWWHLDEAAD